MHIRIDDLSSTEIAEFLMAHIEDMKASSPPESKHALDIEGLKSDDITFWSMIDDDNIIACGALKELNSTHAELKSMRTAKCKRRNGVGSQLLVFILEEAKQRKYSKVSLETGTMAFFKPAHRFYRKFGFEECAPFSDYSVDPNSLFMTKYL